MRYNGLNEALLSDRFKNKIIITIQFSEIRNFVELKSISFIRI